MYVFCVNISYLCSSNFTETCYNFKYNIQRSCFQYQCLFDFCLEADATKSAKGRSSPSPTSDHGLLVKANADVKRLEALCEGRTKELNMVKMNLKSGLQGFEAMTILVQYLTQKVGLTLHYA